MAQKLADALLQAALEDDEDDLMFCATALYETAREKRKTNTRLSFIAMTDRDCWENFRFHKNQIERLLTALTGHSQSHCFIPKVVFFWARRFAGYTEEICLPK